MHIPPILLFCCDHCRIGSLENQPAALGATSQDHCRIGSLEMQKGQRVMVRGDHCRIGSLEN